MLDDLFEAAEHLAHQYATPAAVHEAMNPTEHYPYPVHTGEPWPLSAGDPSVGGGSSHSSAMSVDSDSLGSNLETFSVLSYLANTTIFIRNAIWWREFDTGGRQGDAGRLYEIMKVYLD